jgi:hypothetical protein
MSLRLAEVVCVGTIGFPGESFRSAHAEVPLGFALLARIVCCRRPSATNTTFTSCEAEMFSQANPRIQDGVTRDPPCKVRNRLTLQLSAEASPYVVDRRNPCFRHGVRLR